MKTLITILTTTILFTILGASCVKNKPNCGALPCPTASGANVVSCLVNGKPYIARGGKPDLTSTWGGCKQGSYYQEASGLSPKTFNFRFCDSGYPDNMYFYIYENLVEKTYILNHINRGLTGGPTFHSATDSINTGIIKITTLTDKVIAGSFEFTCDTKNPQIGIQKFTQGSFDLAR